MTFWKNLERYSDSEVRAALGWDRKTDSGRLGSIFAACAGRQISFPKLSSVNGEEWWKCKNTSPIFLGCCQFTKLSRRLDKYNDRFSPSAVGKLFFDTSIPRLQLIWCYTCPWHVEGFMYGHHPTWVNHSTIFTPFAYHLIIQVKFYSPYCNSPFPMIPSPMIPLSYLSSNISSMLAQESPSSVEPWVVRAISEGVIDGRIDQLNRKVPGMKVMRCWWL